MANENNELQTISGKRSHPPAQGILDLRIQNQTDVDGVGMGVLSDGTPFLTDRGLARLCSAGQTAFQGIIEDWADEPPKVRVARIKERLLRRDGKPGGSLYLAIKQRNGSTGKVDLVFLHAMTKFENRAEDLPEITEKGGHHFE